MGYKNLLLEAEEGTVLLKINRPKALNALNRETLLELQQALREIEGKGDVQVVILTGEGGKSFVAGADIAEMKDMTAAEALAFSQLGHATLGMIENLKRPVIAAVNGYALGGGLEIALACDFIYASEKAKLGLPEVTLGIFPGFGGTQRLPRLIGKARARELIYTGEMIDAQTAREVGIINKVFPPEDLLGEVRKTARRIAQNGPVGVSLAKEAVNAGYGLGTDEGEAIEMTNWAHCFATRDQKEAMEAFLEKRKPEFKGE